MTGPPCACHSSSSPISLSSDYTCRVVTCLRKWKNKLVEAGFQELVFEDAMEVVIDQLNSLGTAEPLKTGTLEENMRSISQSLFASC